MYATSSVEFADINTLDVIVTISSAYLIYIQFNKTIAN